MMPPQPATTKLGAVRVPGEDPRREPDDDVEPAPPAPITSEAAFVFLSGQMSEVAGLCRQTRNEFAAFTGAVDSRLGRLEFKVFGSKPPPMTPMQSTAPGELAIRPAHTSPPLVKQMATHDNSIETLAQEVSNLRGELGVVKSMNGQQSKAMGLAAPDASLAKKTRAYVFSRAGIKEMTGLALAVAFLVQTLRGGSPPPAATPAAPVLSAPAGTR